MSLSVENAIRRSSKDFVEVVWPQVSGPLGGGDLIPVETVTANHFATILDRTAGIDAWIVQRDRHVFGLGSRVQWMREDQVPYKTFTVRLKLPSGRPTEYAKRQDQIATRGSIYPEWTAQAYLADGDRRLLTAALASTRDVIAAVTLGVGFERSNPDGTRFWCVPWRDLWSGGCQSLHVIDSNGLHSREGV